MMKDPDHPIIENPWTWDLTDFHFHKGMFDFEDCWMIDIVLEKDNQSRRLRFINPGSIKIDPGFPQCSGLFISDISKRQLSGRNVYVGNFENSSDGIEFWAKEVIDLDEEKLTANKSSEPT